MDKNSIIGILLIVGILVTFGIFTQKKDDGQPTTTTKTQTQQVASNPTANSATNTDSIMALKADSIKLATMKADTNGKDSVNAKLRAEYGAFGVRKIGEEKFFVAENDLLKIRFTNKGARPYSVELKKFKTYDKKPLKLIDGANNRFGMTFFSENKNVATNDLYFEVCKADGTPFAGDSMAVGANDSMTVCFRLFPDSLLGQNKYIEYSYKLKGGSYMVDMNVKLKDLGDLVVANSNSIDFEWSMYVKQLEKSLENEKIMTTIYYKSTSDDEVDYLSETSAGEEKMPTQVRWVGFKQQFFTSVFIADKSFTNANIITNLLAKEDTSHVKDMNAFVGLPYTKGQAEPIALHMYFGPNKYNILKSYDLDLERQIPLGWSFAPMAWFNKWIVLPVFNILEDFNLNYGIIILILTLFVKTLLFPIAYKTYLSSAKMKVLKPEIDEISAKFPKQEDAMKKQQTLMALYKKAGVSPMAGCVPMLLQFPILIALFRFFPAAIELRQQSFLWATDLSSYDSILELGFNIPFYGDHVSLFTILMTISTLIYTKMNADNMGSSQQMPGMKTMMYIMPIMFLGIFNNYASGLSYYYFLANMITFGQQWVFKTFIVNEAKLHAQIQENKKKNFGKKSKFQAKLEEMAKQKGYKMPKK